MRRSAISWRKPRRTASRSSYGSASLRNGHTRGHTLSRRALGLTQLKSCHQRRHLQRTTTIPSRAPRRVSAATQTMSPTDPYATCVPRAKRCADERVTTTHRLSTVLITGSYCAQKNKAVAAFLRRVEAEQVHADGPRRGMANIPKAPPTRPSPTRSAAARVQNTRSADARRAQTELFFKKFWKSAQHSSGSGSGGAAEAIAAAAEPEPEASAKSDLAV